MVTKGFDCPVASFVIETATPNELPRGASRGVEQ
jgi:hypothetical protein